AKHQDGDARYGGHAGCEAMTSDETSGAIPQAVGLRFDRSAFEEAFDVVGELPSGAVPPFRLRLQRLEYDAVDVTIQTAREARGRGPAHRRNPDQRCFVRSKSPPDRHARCR